MIPNVPDPRNEWMQQQTRPSFRASGDCKQQNLKILHGVETWESQPMKSLCEHQNSLDLCSSITNLEFWSFDPYPHDNYVTSYCSPELCHPSDFVKSSELRIWLVGIDINVHIVQDIFKLPGRLHPTRRRKRWVTGSSIEKPLGSSLLWVFETFETLKATNLMPLNHYWILLNIVNPIKSPLNITTWDIPKSRWKRATFVTSQLQLETLALRMPQWSTPASIPVAIHHNTNRDPLYSARLLVHGRLAPHQIHVPSSVIFDDLTFDVSGWNLMTQSVWPSKTHIRKRAWTDGVQASSPSNF